MPIFAAERLPLISWIRRAKLCLAWCAVILGTIFTSFSVNAQEVSSRNDVAALAQVSDERSREEGLPYFFEHFTAQDYRQYPQNWAIVQDQRGVMYVANADGVLAFDGASWRLIPTVTNTVIRSLAVDGDGVVYVGAYGDFGYLTPDSTGLLSYESLIEQVPQSERDFKDVWGTHATSDGIFFQAPERLFFWDGVNLQSWTSTSEFRTSFSVRDRFYVREHEVGLRQFVDGELSLIPGGSDFADVAVFMMAPYRDHHILIGTRTEHLLLYDGATTIPFSTEADSLLSQHRLYHGRAIQNGHFALAMLDDGGVVVLDEQGRLVRHLSRETGLLDGWVNYVYSDLQGGLWMALNDKGVARADVFSPLSKYELDGTIHSIARHRERLYVATTSGLMQLEPAQSPTPGSPKLVEVEGIRGIPRFLVPTDTTLLIAADTALYSLRENQLEVIADGLGTMFEAIPSAHREGALFLGTANGLVELQRNDTGWEVRHRLAEISTEVRSVAETADGSLWGSTMDGQVFRVTWNGAADNPTSTWFDASHGLPAGYLHVLPGKEASFTSVAGVYVYEEGAESAQTFRLDDTYSNASSPSDSLFYFTRDDEGRAWMVYADRVDIATVEEGGLYSIEQPAALRFPKTEIVELFVEDDGIAWFGEGNQLVRYDSRVQRDYAEPFTALVRQVTTLDAPFQILGGDRHSVAQPTSLSFNHNNLRFEVGAPSYNDVAATRYQYFLDGVDRDWSAWTSWSSRSYANIQPGPYTFRVRARNGQGVVSDEGTWSFRMMPPWYRTGMAYGIYVLMLGGVLAFGWRYRTMLQENKRAQAQARDLLRERQFNERLQEANTRLQEANEGLQQVNKLKDEFLANTSHELRTPLTAILGFASLLQEELPEQYQEFLEPIEANSQRLLQTVNALLDIAKLRAGMVEVNRVECQVEAKVGEVMRLLKPLADQKGLVFEMDAPEQPLYAHLDPDYLERILYNLIGNAIKFTDAGKVGVTILKHGNHVCLRISDTGIGIDEGFLPYLFDEFKQESTGLTRTHEGSGLGLAITARLIELMDGQIEVQSEKGKGSAFTVSFPLSSVNEEEVAKA